MDNHESVLGFFGLDLGEVVKLKELDLGRVVYCGLTRVLVVVCLGLVVDYRSELEPFEGICISIAPVIERAKSPFVALGVVVVLVVELAKSPCVVLGVVTVVALLVVLRP